MDTQIAVTYSPTEKEREIYREYLGGLAQIVYMKDLPDGRSMDVLEGADIVVSRSFSLKKIRKEDLSILGRTRFIQLIFSAEKIVALPGGLGERRSPRSVGSNRFPSNSRPRDK